MRIRIPRASFAMVNRSMRSMTLITAVIAAMHVTTENIAMLEVVHPTSPLLTPQRFAMVKLLMSAQTKITAAVVTILAPMDNPANKADVSYNF